MHYGNIKKFSIENGPGVRVSLFVSGCRNHCKNCFSQHTWDFQYGQEFTKDTMEELLDSLRPSHIEGLTILGGEPFEPENQKELIPVIQKVRAEIPDKTIWMYTGFTIEELIGEKESRANIPEAREILGMIDVLVDGRFSEEQKSLAIRFRGSENQRIIDVPATLKEGKILLREEYMDKKNYGK
ncbi:MAG: anaerobic ribonucleoside-triphosphate reductase activating protein [Blautia sp.]|nr:anaerobic ribonucleoside-triphosphate reductase activating protein [Blautia sp.]